MAVAATKIDILVKPPEIRRFALPDIDRHGAWLAPRIVQAFPHLDVRRVPGWLQGMLHSNEFLFLFSENAVGLAQMLTAHTLQPRPVVWERFVFARTPEHVIDAAHLYARFADWAKQIGSDVMIVEENTDVPHEAIKEQLGRLFTRQQTFARL